MASLSTSSTRATLISSPSSTSSTLLHDIKQEKVDYDTDIDINTIVKKPTMPRTLYKPRMAHIYAVMVKDYGTILLQDGTGPPKVLPHVWFKVDMDSFYLACRRFEGVLKKGDLTELLACILQPSNSLNNLCRRKVYRELVKYAGYKERQQPLTAYLVKAVRDVFPDGKGKYMGFMAK
jgi:hypothetical protein